MVGMAGPPTATMDFNAFFDEEEPDYTTANILPTEAGFHVKQHIAEQAAMQPRPLAQSTMKPETRQEPDTPTTQPTLVQEFDNIRAELQPDDSSSNIGRYKKKYLHPGTVLATRRGGVGGAVHEDLVRYDLPAIPEVVVGFVKTAEIARKEVLNYHKVTPINGLARPFRNSRLNLLCHLHTAVVKIAGTDRPADLVRILKGLGSKRTHTPTAELLNQVIRLTFDWDDMEVAANPFDLPYIEPHMKISDDCLLKCLDLLWLEYKRLWFDQVKSLAIPAFAFDYQDVSDSKLTEPKPHRSRHYTAEEIPSKVEEARPKRTESRRSRSILGISRD